MPATPDGFKFDEDVKKFLDESRKARAAREAERSQHEAASRGVDTSGGSGAGGKDELVRLNREMLQVLKEISLKIEGVGLIG